MNIADTALYAFFNKVNDCYTIQAPVVFKREFNIRILQCSFNRTLGQNMKVGFFLPLPTNACLHAASTKKFS